MNQLDEQPSVGVEVKVFMDEDVSLRHFIQKTVVHSIEILPSFYIFPYGTEL